MTGPAPVPPATVRLGPAEREGVQRAWVRAVDRWGALRLDAGDFLERVEFHASKRSRGEDGRADPAAAAAWVRGAALEDLALATACEAGDPRAWETLSAEFRPRLEGFAARRGVCSADAEAVVQDLFGDLSAPARQPGSRTLLGTFDATGSLFGWLCVVLLRRVAGAARRKRTASLETQEPSAVERSRPPSGASPPPDPAAAASEAEALARFDGAFAAGWGRLTPQEQLALLFKHRDGITQRQIGTLLGVGEARVSRVVAAAVGKLALAMGGLAGGALPRGDDPSPAFAAALGRRMARESPVPAPPLGGSAPAPR